LSQNLISREEAEKVRIKVGITTYSLIG